LRKGERGRESRAEQRDQRKGEQNRTEQNRTEQNRTEQNRKEQSDSPDHVVVVQYDEVQASYLTEAVQGILGLKSQLKIKLFMKFEQRA